LGLNSRAKSIRGEQSEQASEETLHRNSEHELMMMEYMASTVILAAWPNRFDMGMVDVRDDDMDMHEGRRYGYT